MGAGAEDEYLSPSEKSQLKSIYDASGGLRDFGTIRLLLNVTCGQTLNDEALTELLNQATYQIGHCMTLAEFLEIMRLLKKKYIEEAQQNSTELAFVALGGFAHSGGVPTERLVQTVKEFELSLDFVADVDADGSGQIDYAEFHGLFASGDGGACGTPSTLTSPRHPSLRWPLIGDDVFGSSVGGGGGGGAAEGPRLQRLSTGTLSHQASHSHRGTPVRDPLRTSLGRVRREDGSQQASRTPSLAADSAKADAAPARLRDDAASAVSQELLSAPDRPLQALPVKPRPSPERTHTEDDLRLWKKRNRSRKRRRTQQAAAEMPPPIIVKKKFMQRLEDWTAKRGRSLALARAGSAALSRWNADVTLPRAVFEPRVMRDYETGRGTGERYGRGPYDATRPLSGGAAPHLEDVEPRPEGAPTALSPRPLTAPQACSQRGNLETWMRGGQLRGAFSSAYPPRRRRLPQTSWDNTCV